MATKTGTTKTKTAAAKKTAATTKTVAEETVEKTTEAMTEGFEKTAEAVTQGFEKIFGDARTNMENLMKNASEFSTYGRESVDAMVESGNILAKGMEALNAEVTAIAQRNFDGSVEAMKALTGVRTAKEYFEVQTDLAKSAWDNVVSDSSKINEIITAYSKDAMEPINGRMTEAMERFKKAAAV